MLQAGPDATTGPPWFLGGPRVVYACARRGTGEGVNVCGRMKTGDAAAGPAVPRLGAGRVVLPGYGPGRLSLSGRTPRAASAAQQEVTRHAKVALLRSFGRTFGGPPQLLILGSSRAMRADPAALRKALHVRAFNAAVSSGSALDAYAFTKLAAQDYPGSRSALVWFVDIETLRLGADQPYVRSVPALRRVLPRGPGGFASASRASRRALAGGAVPGHAAMPPRLRADGVLVAWWHDWQRAHGRTTARGVRDQMQQYAQIYKRAGSYHISGSSRWYATQIVADASRAGVVPVIVLTPYHPALRRFISGRGWQQAHAQALAFFRSLDKRYHLRLLDLTSLKSFGGWPAGFYDGVHPRPAMMKSIVGTVVRRGRGCLEPPDTTIGQGATAPPASAPPAPLQILVGDVGLRLSFFLR